MRLFIRFGPEDITEQVPDVISETCKSREESKSGNGDPVCTKGTCSTYAHPTSFDIGHSIE